MLGLAAITAVIAPADPRRRHRRPAGGRAGHHPGPGRHHRPLRDHRPGDHGHGDQRPGGHPADPAHPGEPARRRRLRARPGRLDAPRRGRGRAGRGRGVRPLGGRRHPRRRPGRPGGHGPAGGGHHRAGTTYEAIFWVKAPGGGQVVLALRELAGGREVSADQAGYTLAGSGWQQLAVEHHTAAPGSSLALEVVGPRPARRRPPAGRLGRPPDRVSRSIRPIPTYGSVVLLMMLPG